MPIVVRQATGLSLYARFDDASNTAVNLTEGTSLKVGRYTAADAAIQTAGLAAGTYSAGIYIGTAGAQANTDALVAEVPEFVWSGTAEVVTSANVATAASQATTAATQAATAATQATTAATQSTTAATQATAANTKIGTPAGASLSADVAAKATASAVSALDAKIGTPADTLAEDIAGIEGGGTSQPRINRKPAPGFTVKISRRADGTHKATAPIRITPGAIDDVFVFIDMSPLFGPEDYVETVGTPDVEDGSSITASASGPRDTYAVVELDGTATASEERTITVPVTMDSGTTVNVVFDVVVFAE